MEIAIHNTASVSRLSVCSNEMRGPPVPVVLGHFITYLLQEITYNDSTICFLQLQKWTQCFKTRYLVG